MTIRVPKTSIAEVALLTGVAALGLSYRALQASKNSEPAEPATAEPAEPATAESAQPTAVRRARLSWKMVRRVLVIVSVPLVASLGMWVGVETAVRPNLLDNPVIVYGAAAYLMLKALDELVSGLASASEFDQAWEAMSKFLRLGLAVAAIGYAVGNDDTIARLVTLTVAVPTLILLATGVMLIRRCRAKSSTPSSSLAQSSGTPENASIVA